MEASAVFLHKHSSRGGPVIRQKTLCCEVRQTNDQEKLLRIRATILTFAELGFIRSGTVMESTASGLTLLNAHRHLGA